MKKKHIHWLLPGDFKDLFTVKNHFLASVRLRAYVSAFNCHNFTFSFGENAPLNTEILVIGKIGNYDLEKRSMNWLNQVKISSFSSSKIIIDYTDNHLMMNSPMNAFYKAILPFITLAITPSEKMTSIFSRFWKGPVETIYDSIEIEISQWRMKNSQKLLWFGHATNIVYLLEFLKKNQSSLQKYSISLITNQNGLNYFTKFYNLNIPVKACLWSASRLVEEAKSCDLCIIPSDLNSPQKQGAGHNRLITAFALGMPVLATTLPSYSRFKDYFVDIESQEIFNILNDPNLLRNKVILAQKNVVPLFNKISLSKKWQKVFKK